jgi:glutamyl-tRNA synthetase
MTSSQTTAVRARVAPSPTGDPHIGTAYMALFNYAFAKSQGGRFLLRVEDTDQARSTRASEQAIFDALRWLGLSWDEGPDVGGPYGPYRQSERTEIYREHCKRLVESGHAYPCFCPAERLDALRKEQTASGAALGYDGHCAALASAEARRRMDAGEPCVIRLRVPAEGDCVFRDRLRGEIRIPWAQVDHQVLMKSDGFPTYHLANVVDDHLMEITHVMRGEEWINSAPKHLLLYEAFGWQAPQFVHLPLLRNPDKSKLSKRKNPTSIAYYRQAGYLPEAVLNYLGLMGWAMPDGRELFTLGEFVEAFDIDKVSLGGPIFDLEKLAWLSGRWMRERLSADDVLERLKGWMLNDATWRKIIPLAQPRAERLADIVPAAACLFADMPAYDAAALLAVKGLGDETTGGKAGGEKTDGKEAAARLIQIVLWELEKIRPWVAEALQACVRAVAEAENVKMKTLMPLLFIAFSGLPVALPLFESMELVGSDMTRRRLAHALAKLADAGAGLSKKALKALENDYRQRFGGMKDGP